MSAEGDTLDPAVQGPDPLLEERDTSKPWRSDADVRALEAEREHPANETHKAAEKTAEKTAAPPKPKPAAKKPAAKRSHKKKTS